MFCLDPSAQSPYLYSVIGLALILGIFVVIPIGGADMPVVISLSEQLFWTGSMRCRICNQQHHPDRRRFTGRCGRHHSDEHHVQSNESLT